MKNNTLLISLLAFLAVIKFILVPIFDWQNELLAETAIFQAKITKSALYIKDIPSFEIKKNELVEKIAQSKKSIEYYNDFGFYKITKQKQIEKLFDKNKIKLTSLSWQTAVDSQLGKQVKLNLQFKGLLKDFIALKLDVISLSRSIKIEKFGVTIKRQKIESLGTITGNFILLYTPFIGVTNEN